jgi:hypothetical protein
MGNELVSVCTVGLVCSSHGLISRCPDSDYLTGNDPKKYLASIAEKEIEWTRQYGEPVQLDFPHNGVLPGEKSPEDYLCLLEKYLALAPYLLPKEPDNPLTRPTLRHPGMSLPLKSSNPADKIEI